MKTSRYIQNFYCYQPNRGQPDVVSPIPEKTHCSRNEQKPSIHRYLGRKLDDSLPDFDGFVVRGFWKCGKREDICMDIVDNLRIIHKKTRRSGFFANRSA
ncbi:hypothetical protein [Enterobacter sp. 262D3]|uniref:hypothetical protein n=1 Tax=Enterobacter sp. 262D3 TaxID=3077763 RepID=UPI002A830535|nr:hypothetical protein [Enterobacter sp. 262D3]